MKLKRTRKQRTCCNCQAPISKGAFYGQKTKTILNDPQGQSFNGGRSWEPFKLTQKLIFCESCSQ